jgi:putative transposase
MTQPKFKGKYRVESSRLVNYNYAANGWYFITVCTGDRNPFFGNVNTSLVERRNFASLQLSAIGEIAQNCWADIPNHFDYTYIDTYVIMPNHIHGIIIIDRPNQINKNTPPKNVETRNFASLQQPTEPIDQSNQFGPLKQGSLQAIIHAYKSAVTRQCRKNGYDSFAWQPRFYEHIIRTDDSLERIRQYIINNPAQWEIDQHNPTNLWM